MGAIRWKIDVPDILTGYPYAAMCRGVIKTYAIERERTVEALKIAKLRDPTVRHKATAPMMVHVRGDEWPEGIGLSSFHCMGVVPAHIDSNFLPYSYLYLLDPGPYLVLDEAMDLAPQRAGMLICFNDHEQHLLYDPSTGVEVFDNVSECRKAVLYDEVPAESWIAFTFDHADQLDPKAAVAEFGRRLDAWWAALDLHRRTQAA